MPIIMPWLKKIAAGNVARCLLQSMKGLSTDNQGNFGMVFGLIAVPLIISMGAALDYTRSYNARVEMQSNLDQALIAAIKRVDSLDESELKVEIARWFAAAPASNVAPYNLLSDSIEIDKSNRTIKATASATVPTTFLGIANRGGSVCLNSLGRFAKWISASIMPPPSLVPAR